MPLDTSSYALSLLRLDGRRWNELRRLHAQISTQPAADGSSYLEMGNTKVVCTVTGPTEFRRIGAESAGGGGGSSEEARVEVEVNIAGFSSVDRKRKASRGDRRITELQTTIGNTLSPHLLTHIYPRSTILIQLHVLTADGAMLAACINAATLALVDAGVPTVDMVVSCTSGFVSSLSANMTRNTSSTSNLPGLGSSQPVADPLLDLSLLEENELPYLTLATVGASSKVAACVCETRMDVARLEQMLAVAVDGCKAVHGILEGVVRTHGRRALSGAEGGGGGSRGSD